MGVGVTGGETPLAAMRAVVRIEEAEVTESKFRDSRDREQKQFACSLKVLSGAGERDGETFAEWFSFPATGEIGKNTKTGQVIVAVLGDDAEAETLEELAKKLVGKKFACQIGPSRNGKYPRVQHDTITPQEKSGGFRGAQQEASQAANAPRDEEPPLEDAEDPEWDSIPF